MTSLDGDRFRSMLEEERLRVVAAISYLHEENPGTIEDETEEIVGATDNHLAETASVTLDREIDYTLEENSGHVLISIEGALARIEDGSYGRCGSCGGTIAEERLEAVPWATECIDCKRRGERF
ncbi:MAG TPA: TraR/DksA family transcriptional regulator [Gaiellaceae bacterium]